MDLYLFHYKEGSYIPKHKDPKKYGKQYRINLVLWKPTSGGHFWCKGDHINLYDRLIIFRADKYYHGIDKVTSGSRILLSLGIYL